MSRYDWYRRTSWTPEDEQAFRARNKRSRGPSSKAQHLRIQAQTLFDIGKPELAEVACRLVCESLHEAPDAMDRAMTLDLAGLCCWKLGRHEESVRYFHAALTRQSEFPGVQSNAAFHLGKLAAEQRLTSEYDAVLQAIDAFGAPVFPWHAYMSDGIRAIVADDRGDARLALELAASALRAAEITDSGLGAGRNNLGLVRDKDTLFHRRLQAILASSTARSY